MENNPTRYRIFHHLKLKNVDIPGEAYRGIPILSSTVSVFSIYLSLKLPNNCVTFQCQLIHIVNVTTVVGIASIHLPRLKIFISN
jgi:hypothetical protein